MSIDQALLLKINSWHNAFLDTFFWNYSQKWTWVGLYILLVGYIVYRYRKNAVWILLAIGATFGLADWGSHELKYIFMRPRPTHDSLIGDMVLTVNGYRGGQYGFPSSHACNSFALATILGLVSRDRLLTITLIAWATLNAYSRIYLGVHYPGDILMGGLMGMIIAIICYLPLYYTKKNEPYARCNTKTELSFRISIPAMWILIMIAICFV